MRKTHYSNSLAWTLIQKLKSKYPEWIHKGELLRYGIECGYLSENAARRLRELKNEGWVIQRMKGKSLEYCYNQRHEIINPSGSVTIKYESEIQETIQNTKQEQPEQLSLA